MKARTSRSEVRIGRTAVPNEAQTTDEGARTVQIMTIHQAKGLEFPIVIIPDCGRRRRLSSDQMLFGDDDRFSLRFTDPESLEPRRPAEYLNAKEEDDLREKAEYVRLLYVAATRAQDRVVFSGSPAGKEDRDSWLAWLNGFAAQRPDLIRVSEMTDFGELRRAEPEPEGEGALILTEGGRREPAEPGPRARAVLARILDRKPPRPRVMTLNVTGMTGYLACPRRFYLEDVAGLPPRTTEAEVSPGPGPGLNPRQKGIVFHYLMETIDLNSPPSLEALAETAAAKALTEGVRAQPGQPEELAARALEFLETPWGVDLLASESGRVRRELPIWLRIDPAEPDGPQLILTGEIDLFYVTPGGLARVVDYKYARPKEAERYQSQLRIYALALLRAGMTGNIEAGLYFTHEQGREMVKVPLPPGWDEDFEKDLQAAALDIRRFMGSDPEEPAPPPTCPDPACGFKYACRSG